MHIICGSEGTDDPIAGFDCFCEHMIFNSIEYFVFFGIVLALYFRMGLRWQNRMLLAASYYFYGSWDWRCLSLILITTSVVFFCGLKIFEASEKHLKKMFLLYSIIINLGILGVFKYWNFFLDSLVDLLTVVGFKANIPLLKIILPVGISFYTFQAMSYSIDVYRNAITPTKNFFNFALYISFFPQLVAGPIERATALLPQIENERKVTPQRFVEGLNLIFWGLYKKVFVADNLAIIVDKVYSNPQSSGVEYIIATWAFAFQIYGDFSGYTDIARGSSKCLGIELMANFNAPYLAVDPSDFWKRWHISLSTWLKDYLYIPLGGNKNGNLKTYCNLSITMLLGGLWHGAAWNYVIWGAYHGVLLAFHRFFTIRRVRKSDFEKSIVLLLIRASLMFQLTCVGWIFFRAHSFEQIQVVFSRILQPFEIDSNSTDMLLKTAFYASLPLVAMCLSRLCEFWKDCGSTWYFKAIQSLSLQQQPLLIKSISLGVMSYLMLLYGTSSKTFIYFQF